MIRKGFAFGMLLQLAVGPVCLFIFQTAALKGFSVAESGVLGVAFIDGTYILAAILGIAALIERKNIQILLKLFGAAVLFIFGTSTFLGVFHIQLLPSLNLGNTTAANNVFLQAIILTASNPLTIIFMAGVFSAKITAENMNRNEVYGFGIGVLLSTIFFLTGIAVAGSLIKTFFPAYIIQFLNLLVGILLIYFSIKMFFKKV